MAFNWDKLCKAQRDYPRPKFALDAVSKLLKKRPNDPYLLAWKATTLLKHHGRADEALPILTSLCQQQPPITDPDLLPFIYQNILKASRQVDTNPQPVPSVGADGLKAWQNAAKVLTSRKARQTLWSDLFIVAMKEECWDDVRWATMQANKEGIDPKSRKASYFSLILANQLGGERKAQIAKLADGSDAGNHIQLTLAHRQMKDAYDHSPKSTDGNVQVTTMSDLRFMASVYERQNRCQELFQLWDKPPAAVQKIIDGASFDFALLGLEIAYRQKAWEQVEKMCYRLIDTIWQSDNPITDDPSLLKANMFSICTMCWTMWKSLLDATTHLHPDVEGKAKVEKIFSGIWSSLPTLEQRTYRALGLTQLSLEYYLGHPILDTMKRYYLECFRNPSCFKDLRPFVILLSVEEQNRFQATISEHARNLGATVNDKGAILDEHIKTKIRVWHEAETTVLKFELLTIASLSKSSDISVLEHFVCNALRLWRLQLTAEGPDAMCGSDVLLIAIEALVYLFEGTSCLRYLYQATVLARHSLSLDKQQHCRNIALLSTRLHLKLGLGSVAFEHYDRVRAKEMLLDNIAWVPLSRISQSHPFGAGGSQPFSARDELEKVISTLSRMERKVDHLLYSDLQYFMYDKAFDLLQLKQKLRTSLTKQFCTIERRRIARLAGNPVDTILDIPLRGQEDISDNCQWDAIPRMDHMLPSRFQSAQLSTPITKTWVRTFGTLIDVVNGIAFKEFPPGQQAYVSRAPLTANPTGENPIASDGEQDDKTHFTPLETGLLEFYWKPIAHIMQAMFPSEKVTVWSQTRSIEEAFERIFSQLKVDADELRVDDLEANADRAMHLTEENLLAVYGRFEVLRVLHRLLDSMRPISKARTHALHKEITAAKCDLLYQSINEVYRLYRARIQAVLDRLRKTGTDHIRTELLSGTTGAAIDETIANGPLKRYSKEYTESAIEALKGVLKVQLD